MSPDDVLNKSELWDRAWLGILSVITAVSVGFFFGTREHVQSPSLILLILRTLDPVDPKLQALRSTHLAHLRRLHGSGCPAHVPSAAPGLYKF